MEKYGRPGDGSRGCSLVTATEVMKTRKVFTVDRNDFAVHWIKLEHRYYAFEIIG
jgi:hypothetical protein